MRSEHAVNVVVCQVRKRLGIERLGIITPSRQQLTPPGEEKLLHDKLEPRRESCWVKLGHELLELFGRHVLCVADLVHVGFERDLGSDEEDVVDLVLAPLVLGVVVGCEVVDAGEVLELVKGDLLSGNAELVVELTLSSAANA